MEQTIIDLVRTILENPVVGPAILSGVRAITGYLQLKWKGISGKEFSKGEVGATLLKYEVAMNALAAVLPADFVYIEALVVIADIVGSWGRKLLKR